ncbi:methyl-accepting chemotaxis protein, partial [Paraburkholderia sp. SIMBA_050]
LQGLVDDNNAIASDAAKDITNAVEGAKTSIEVALGLAVVVAAVCGYLLLRSITVPMGGIVSLLTGMRGGDLRQRMALGRRDEFLAVEEGF